MTPNLSYIINLACQAHAKQTRLYTGESYIVHLAEVAMLTERWIRQCLGDTLAPIRADSLIQTSVAIAWCHDLLEDTPWTEAEFRVAVREAGFPPFVADGVVALTDDPAVPGGPNRAARKRRTIERISGADILVQLVKLADGHSNAQSIRVHDPDFYKTFRKEKLELFNEGMVRLRSDAAFEPIVQLVVNDLLLG